MSTMSNSQLKTKAKPRKRKIKAMLLLLIILPTILLLSVLAINLYVKESTSQTILQTKNITDYSSYDCILVLGCLVHEDGTPSVMLKDRLDRGIELYKVSNGSKLLMSGDNGTKSYDEVNVMKQYAIDKGVPSEDIFMDHAGFSTYESMYRAKAIFGIKNMLIVTQEYHLYRALYIARALGLKADGVSADYREYAGHLYNEVRESLARCKDLLTSIAKPLPTHMGESINIHGNGDITND